MLFQKAYFKKRDGLVVKRSIFMKLFMGIVAAGFWAVNLASVLSNEADWQSSQGALSACDSSAARQALNDAVENNASSNLRTLRLLDVTNVQEIASQTSSDIRLCLSLIHI